MAPGAACSIAVRIQIQDAGSIASVCPARSGGEWGTCAALRCTSLLRSVVLFDLDPRAAVVAVKRRAFFVAGALVRAVAKRLVFGKAAGADPYRQFGALGNFVRSVAFVLNQSGH